MQLIKIIKMPLSQNIRKQQQQQQRQRLSPTGMEMAPGMALGEKLPAGSFNFRHTPANSYSRIYTYICILCM